MMIMIFSLTYSAIVLQKPNLLLWYQIQWMIMKQNTKSFKSTLKHIRVHCFEILVRYFISYSTSFAMLTILHCSFKFSFIILVHQTRIGSKNVLMIKCSWYPKWNCFFQKSKLSTLYKLEAGLWWKMSHI